MFLYMREPRVITSPSNSAKKTRQPTRPAKSNPNPYPDYEQSFIIEEAAPAKLYEPENNHVIGIDI